MIDQEVIPSHNPEEEYSIGNQQENQRTDFLEISVIAEIIQLIEQIDNKCQGQIALRHKHRIGIAIFRRTAIKSHYMLLAIEKHSTFIPRRVPNNAGVYLSRIL